MHINTPDCWNRYTGNMPISSTIVILFSFLVYGLIHSLLAARRWKQYLAKRFPSAYQFYRLGYSIFAVITLLPIFWLIKSLPDRVLYQIPRPWVFVTLIIQFVVLVVILIGFLQTGPLSFIGINQIFQRQTTPEKLREVGLYRWMRHPIYSLGFVLMWLFPIMTVNLLSLWVGITLYIFVGAWLEERKLLVDFPEYRSYQQRTPMYLPRKPRAPD